MESEWTTRLRDYLEADVREASLEALEWAVEAARATLRSPLSWTQHERQRQVLLEALVDKVRNGEVG